MGKFRSYFTDGYFGMLDDLTTMIARLKKILVVNGDVSEIGLTVSLMNLKNNGK